MGFSYYCKGRLCKKFIWKLSKRIIQEEKKTKSCGNHRCPIDWVLFRKALSFDWALSGCSQGKIQILLQICNKGKIIWPFWIEIFQPIRLSIFFPNKIWLNYPFNQNLIMLSLQSKSHYYIPLIQISLQYAIPLFIISFYPFSQNLISLSR